jgi:inner membrane protein
MLIGASAALLIFDGHQPDQLALLAAAALIGATLPDLDHTGSWAGRRLAPLSWLVSLLGHRQATHSALAVICGAALWHFTGQHQAALAVLVGYASHIAADMLTPAGVALFWPLAAPVAVPRWLAIRTGSATEGVLGVLLVLALLGQMITRL